ncbi:hypothetical protein EJ06DRAFT_296202 [Trichodelitschia bisporula]|uniref:Uncharacterized protein n=1 Tax=Trichodelitschia bisporula TaxID=703511 RepID=A0A6G1I6B0_9PEZI|nr:hypothetical protein EJ06DRAFT_296202 [Trichodelitschia bisporula]
MNIAAQRNSLNPTPNPSPAPQSPSPVSATAPKHPVPRDSRCRPFITSRSPQQQQQQPYPKSSLPDSSHPLSPSTPPGPSLPRPAKHAHTPVKHPLTPSRARNRLRRAQPGSAWPCRGRGPWAGRKAYVPFVRALSRW